MQHHQHTQELLYLHALVCSGSPARIPPIDSFHQLSIFEVTLILWYAQDDPQIFATSLFESWGSNPFSLNLSGL